MEQDFLFPNLNEYNYNPLNDVLFKFILARKNASKSPLLSSMRYCRKA